MGATRSDVLEFRKWLEDSKRSPYTICCYISILRMFYRYLYIDGPKCNIMDGIRGVKRQKFNNKRPLMNDQVKTLLGSIDVSTGIGSRDMLILVLMIFAGLRSCEVARLDVQDFTATSNGATLKLQRKGHTTKDRIIPVADNVRDAIRDYLSTRKASGDEPMIISHNRRCREPKRMSPTDIEHIVTGRMKEAGVNGDRISPHSLRHTFGCMLIEADVPIDQVQTLMGHNSIDATTIYVHMAAERKLFSDNPANKIKIK